jgi:hypothetical protein
MLFLGSRKSDDRILRDDRPPTSGDDPFASEEHIPPDRTAQVDCTFFVKYRFPQELSVPFPGPKGRSRGSYNTEIN